MFLIDEHSLRALELLDRFMSMGPWAVQKALSVGIFPYVFKLLSSPALVRCLLSSHFNRINEISGTPLHLNVNLVQDFGS